MEKSIVITKEMVTKTILFGACRVPEIVTRIEQIPQSDLLWEERMLPIKGVDLRIPLWTLSGYGYGAGAGDGDGAGYGYGDGYGDGDGDGAGYGDGAGAGYGSGYGYGYGDG